MNFHLDTLFYLHNVKSSELTEELYTENIWKEAGGTSKPTPKLTPSPEGTPGHKARGWKLRSSGSSLFLGVNTMQGGLSENSTFPSPRPHFPVQPTSKEDGLTMTWLIEIDESVDDFLMKFAPGIYRAFLSVHVRPAECLCWPSGQQWHYTSSCLIFLVVLGFPTGLPTDQVFFHTWKLGLNHRVFHISRAASLCEYLHPSSPLSYSMTSFRSTSKGWIPMFEFCKNVCCRCCLLSIYQVITP